MLSSSPLRSQHFIVYLCNASSSRCSMNIFAKLLRSAYLAHYARNYSAKSHVYKEVRIPWVGGEIAGKWWGPQDVRPILAIHGWQDNCGTFDRLVPLLPPGTAILAVDLPGHGCTNWLPPGMFYHGVDTPVFIRRIIKHFNWPKVSLMGHSLGAMTSFMYTAIYPNEVDFLICIDGLCPFRSEKGAHPDGMANTINEFLKYDTQVATNSKPPSYTYGELEQMLHVGSKKSIAIEMCKYILQRNIVVSQDNPEKFYITRDPRLKVGALTYLSKEDVALAAQRIVCPLFFSLGQSSQILWMCKLMLDTFSVIQGFNKNAEYHSLEGCHHLHLNNPEELADRISLFIKKHSINERIDCSVNDKMRVVQSV